MMSCCGLLPALRDSFRRRRKLKKGASSDKTESMTEDAVAPPPPPPLREEQQQQQQQQQQQAEDVVPVVVDENSITRQVDVEFLDEFGEVLPPAPRISKTEYVATGYCGLCRTQLPHNPLPILVPRTEPWEQWERDCRAVLCVDVYGETDHIITPPFTLQDEDFEASLSTPVSHPEIDGVVLQLKVPLLDNHLAYVFHSFCYDVLKSKTEHVSSETIYQLAKSLSHEASPWETIGTDTNGWLDPPSRIGNLIGDLNDEAAMKLLPGFLSRLPAELRAPIWNFVGTRSAYSSFLLVSEETSRLVPLLKQSSQVSITIEEGAFLDYKLINLFGTHYLKSLGNDQTKDAIEIKDEVQSISVIASLPGICAIKLVGKSWESEWIGKIPLAGQLWYGTLRDVGTTLYLKLTDLTVLDVRHKQPPQLMWDRPDFPPYLVERDQLKDEALWLRWQSASRFEFMRLLPLYCGKEPARGLTLYCSNLGVIGLASHFSNTTFYSGYTDGMPTYISFRPGEGIKNMWYRLGIAQMDAPSFVIQTTKGHYYHIGPYMIPHTQAIHCRWAPLNNYSYASITHIFYQNPRREICCCAVHGTTTNRTLLPRTTYVPNYPISDVPVMGDPEGESETNDVPVPGNGLFLSTAKLASIKKAQTCRVGTRIVGLLITYEDGSEVALAQWFEQATSARAKIETVYGQSPSHAGLRIDISFRLEGPDRKKFVTSVEFLIGGEGKRELKLGDVSVDVWMGQSIAWWYSRHYDEIVLWNGESYDITPEHHVSLDAGA